jgi:phospholipid/cholesterol/gamma-HCH transport system permease protein
VLTVSTGTAVLIQGVRPLTWRRTVRHEFIHQCDLIGLKSIPFTVVIGVAFGLGFVYQLLYWLGFLGQSELVGGLLIPILAREMGPIVAGLIVLGRSGSVMVVELGDRKAGGQIQMLDAEGVDPFLFLVVPRVLAAALSTFCLTVIFVVTALGSGFVLDNALEATSLTVIDFVDLMLQALGPSDFAVIPLKCIFIGFFVALIACMAGLSEQTAEISAESLIPGVFARALLAILVISGLFTLLF